MVPLVEKLVQMVKMVIPLVPMVQMLPTNGTIGRTPNTRIYSTLRAFVVLTNGKNGTIGRQIPFNIYQWYQDTAANDADRIQRR